MSRATRILYLTPALLASVLAAPCAVAAEEKPVSIYVGSGPGGGYDLYGRLVARHIGRHLPGSPPVAAQNMPGAGSIAMANFIYNVAPKDGTALGIGSPSLSLLEALGTQGIRFETAKLNWIGRVAPITNVTVSWATSPVKTLDEARARKMLVGAISPNSPLTQLPKALNNVLKTQFEIISGYADSNATLLAMERGEVEGSTVSWDMLRNQKSEWLRDRKVNLLVQYTLERARDLPDVPTALEAARTPEERQIISIYVSGADVGYAIFAPPGTPEARVAALRNGFADMLADEKLLADVEKSGIAFDPTRGEKIQAILTAEAKTYPEVRGRLKALSDAAEAGQ
ncbi:MAG: tripartite tricarboxylate transporter family receptor [Hyphomicrobiales bacterium]|nr:tripartite tricarboxylate transporter family receptor [Hyphomicrobiales bacterium]